MGVVCLLLTLQTICHARRTAVVQHCITHAAGARGHLEQALEYIWQGKIWPQLLICDVELGFPQTFSPEADIPLP